MLYANSYNKHSYFVRPEDKITDLSQCWGDLKITSQTSTKGAGTAHTQIPQEMLDSAGESQNEDDSANETDLQSDPRHGPFQSCSQFSLVPTRRPYFKFIHRLCATSLLKIKQCGKDTPSS